jgi:hypothetical protein
LRREVSPHVSRHYPAFIATTSSCATPNPSHRLGITFGQRVFAGRCQPRLGVGASRRCSANLSLRAWTPTPAALVVPSPVSSHKTSAFPTLGPGRRFAISIQQLPYGLVFEAAVIHSCSGPQICSPPRLLLPQCFHTGQPWLLRPSLSRFVTSPCPGYANRPFRATDGKRTFTSQASQPCRLLP